MERRIQTIRKKYLFLFSLMFLVYCSAFGQWEQFSKGIFGANVKGFTRIGSKIFVATYGGGVYKSENNGETWISTNTGLNNVNVTCIAADQGIIIVGTDGGGFYRSENGGLTWSETNNGIVGKQVLAVAMSGKLVVAATDISYGYFLYRSEDCGISWTPILNTHPYCSVYCITIGRKGIYIGSALGLHFSNDNCNTWQFMGLSGQSPQCIKVIGDTVIVGSFSGLYYATDNLGFVWKKLLNEWIFSMDLSLGSMFICGHEGISRSDNFGQSWTKLSNGLPESDNKVIWSFDNYLLIGHRNCGVFRSYDFGNSWIGVNDGLTNVEVISISQNDNALVVLTRYNKSYFRENRNETWSQIVSDFPFWVKALTVKQDSIFLGTKFNGVFCTTDNGITWLPVGSGLASSIVSSVSANQNYLYAGTLDGVWQIGNNGGAWHQVLSSLNGVYLISAKDSIVYACKTNGSGVYKSQDNGQTWSYIHITNNNVRSILIGTPCSYLGLDNGLLRSADNGNTWKAITYTLPSISVNALASLGTDLFAGTDSGVFYSPDKGDSWKEISYGLQNRYIGSLLIKDGYVYAGTKMGVWRRSLQNLERTEPEIVLYPNPSKGLIYIEYEVQSYSAFVDVVSISGQIVKSEKLGKSRFNLLDIGHLSRGIYLIKVFDGNVLVTRKVIKY